LNTYEKTNEDIPDAAGCNVQLVYQC
jgi:hypothetical protein